MTALIGQALDLAVHNMAYPDEPIKEGCSAPPYSSDWAFGGPIIEAVQIFPMPTNYGTTSAAAFVARENKGLPRSEQYGPTPLIAAMRCYVTSKGV